MKPATYVLVWLALVVLATISLLVAQAPIGEWAVVVALAIATVKAALVLAYFMHLARGDSLHRFVIAVAIGFLVLLALGVLADVAWRSAASAYVDDVGRP